MQHFGKDALQGAIAEKQTTTEIMHHDELEQYSGRELLAELRQTLIGRDVHVPTVEGVKPYINLDNGASTPTFSAISIPIHAPKVGPFEKKSRAILYLHQPYTQGLSWLELGPPSWGRYSARTYVP